MFRINPIPRQVLITTDEVIAAGHTGENPQIRQLLAAIQIAEERFVKPLIGIDFYNDFRAQKNVVADDVNIDFLTDQINEGNTSDPVMLSVGDTVNALELVTNQYYVSFWNEHLWKITAEAVIYIATPTNYIRFEAAGEMINNPKTLGMDAQGSASAGWQEIKWKMDKMMQDRLDPLIAAAKEWLCINIGNYPLYDSSNCYDSTNAGISYERKSAWIFGLYDKKKSGYCCE